MSVKYIYILTILLLTPKVTHCITPEIYNGISSNFKAKIIHEKFDTLNLKYENNFLEQM